MADPGFGVQARSVDGNVVLDLHGDLNAFAESVLNKAYLDAEQAHPGAIILNFTSIGYINSTGIALIVGLMARARKADQKLGVYGLSEHYREIFAITRLSDFLPIYADEDSAIRSVSKRSQ